jgi:hypothetical protein
VPILIISGASSGDLMKWEAAQSSQFIYNHDTLSYIEGIERVIEQERQKG